ncbi:hypothetical protein GCM10025856_21550 [Methylophaga marina]|nr:hypothetical protein GCM10025856_21550 [Methylophaga marina]
MAGLVDVVGFVTLGFDDVELGFVTAFPLLEVELDAVLVLVVDRLNLSFCPT